MHGMAVNQKFLSNPAFSLDHFTFRTSNGSVCYCSLYKESFYSIIESCQKCFQNFAPPTCYHSSVIFPTWNVTYFMPLQVLHRLRYWTFKHKSSMSQLPILSKSKSIDICLWNHTGKINNKYVDIYSFIYLFIYIITYFLLAKWKATDINTIKNNV